MRFVATDPSPPTLPSLAAYLKRLDPAYSLRDDVLMHGATPLAQLEINTQGDELFEEERSELVEFATDAEGPGKQRVLDLLHAAAWVLAAQVLTDDADPDGATARLDPMWRWLLQGYHGLLQADGEGYRDTTGLVLEVE